MKRLERLREAERRWHSQRGGWLGDRVVFQGEDLLNGLSDLRWMELFLLGITKRRFSAEQIKLFESMWVLCASYPDPRIWNNRVAALAGSARSTSNLALGAATAVSEATLYGRRADLRAADFLQRAMGAHREGDPVETIVTAELRRYRTLAGYGRPIPIKDERIGPLLKRVTELRLVGGEHLALALRVEQALLARSPRGFLNAAGATAALCLDQGLSPREYYQWASISFSAGIIPCYLEAAEQPEGHFFPLSCERIEYRGVKRRRWQGPL